MQESELYNAASHGDCKKVKSLLEAGADANVFCKGSSWFPNDLPLYAAIRNSCKSTKLLLPPVTDRAKCSSTLFGEVMKSYYHEMPLDFVPEVHKVSLKSNLKYKMSMLELLIDAGEDINLFHQNELSNKRLLGISKLAFSNYLDYADGGNVLTVACLKISQHNINSVMAFLLDHNAHVRNIDYNANPEKPIMSPLLPALQRFPLDIVKRLVLRAGCQINLYHEKAQGNLTILYSLVNRPKLMWLLHAGAEIDSLFRRGDDRKPVALYRGLNPRSCGRRAEEKNAIYLLVQFTTQMQPYCLERIEESYAFYHDPEQLNSLREFTDNPRSLQHLARCKLRKCLGSEILTKRNYTYILKRLGLTKVLIDYMKFTEECKLNQATFKNEPFDSSDSDC